MYIACPLCNARHELTDESPANGYKQDICDYCKANLVFVGAGATSKSAGSRASTAGQGAGDSRAMGIVAFVLVCFINYALLASAVYGVLHGIKDSEAYKATESFISNNREIQAEVGEPMEFGTFPSAHYSSNPGETSADFVINVQGPIGSTVVYAHLLREESNWHIIDAHYVDDKGSAHELVRNRPNPPRAKPAVAPIVVEKAPSTVHSLSEQQIHNVLHALDRAANERNPDGIVEHMSKDVVIDLSLQLPLENQAQTLTRDQYRMTLEKGYASAQDYAFLRKVTSIEFDPDGKTVVVRSTTLESMTIGGNTTQIEAEEVSTLEDRRGRPVITRVQAVGRIATS